MATVLRTLERGWQWEDRQCSHYRQYGKAKIFLQTTTTKVRLQSTGLVGSNLWKWMLDPSQQRGEIYRSFWNVVLRIPWTQHKMNEWILCALKVDRELLDRVKSLKLGFYGHTTRKYESLEKEIIQGCVPGYRNRGRQRRHWDRWHSWMDWDEDQWSGYSSGRLWCTANPSYGGRHWTTTTTIIVNIITTCPLYTAVNCQWSSFSYRCCSYLECFATPSHIHTISASFL